MTRGRYRRKCSVIPDLVVGRLRVPKRKRGERLSLRQNQRMINWEIGISGEDRALKIVPVAPKRYKRIARS